MIYQASGKDLVLKNASNSTILYAAKSIELTIDCEMVEIAASNTSGFREYTAGWKKWSFQVSTLASSSQVGSAPSMVGTRYYAKFTLSGSTSEVVGGYCICTQAKITDTKGQIAKGTFVFQGTGLFP